MQSQFKIGILHESNMMYSNLLQHMLHAIELPAHIEFFIHFQHSMVTKTIFKVLALNKK